MKVLITGGCGFLGSNLAAEFIKKNHQIFIIDSLEREGSLDNLNWLNSFAKNNQLTFLKADICNQEIISKFFKKFAEFNFICHVAGQVAMTKSIINPRKDFETNLLGTFNILECSRLYSPRAFIAYSSTNKVYGDLNSLEIIETDTRYKLNNFPNGLDEKIPLDFSTPYGCSKGAADQYVRDWSRVFGLKTVVFRHSSIYGGRQFSSIDQGWIGWFCKKALEQRIAKNDNKRIIPFTISGTGKQVRDVLNAKDLVNLYCCAYNKKEKISGEIFNIGGGYKNSLSLIELFAILEDKLSISKLNYSKINRRESDQDCFIANIEKAKDLLGWEPKISYEEGIESMINWSKKLIKV
jgi:CDP-paratose 2-epimerase